MNQSAKGFFAKVILTVRFGSAFLAFFVSMELCARIDDRFKYQAPIFGAYGPDLLRGTDKDGISHNVPNSRFEKWEINNFGFRGDPLAPVKRNEVKRIVCLGTSESFGLYEDPNMEWPAQLKALLQNDKRYEVINASVIGLGIEGFIPYFKKYIFHLQPDTVILYVNPYFYLGSKIKERERRGNRPSSQNITNELSKKTKNRISDRLKPRSIPKIIQVIKQHIPQSLLKTYQVWNMSRQVRGLEESLLKGKSPLDVVPREYLESFELDMKNLVNFVKHHRIQVILGTYPTLATKENLKYHPEIFLDARRFTIWFSLNGMIEASNRFNDVLRLVAEKTGVCLVDSSRNVPKNIQYFGDNVHYTNEGARLVARSFRDFILSDLSIASGFRRKSVLCE